VLLFKGFVSIGTNCCLTLIELVPAILIGLTCWDLKVQLFRRIPLVVVDDLALVLIGLGIVAMTLVSS
jgi:hypothetical protein